MRSRVAWAGLVLVLVAISCGPKPADPSLSITAKPSDINDRGEETVIKVVATDGFGKIGKGKVTLTSDSGSLKDGPTFDLDAYGLVTTSFHCDIAEDMYCKGVVAISAKWITEEGQRVSAETRVTITPPPPPPWETGVIWDAAASNVSCSGVAQPSAQPCMANMCAHGFTCVDGLCLLNGGSGGLQYTLRFGQSVDLDLHVVEPVADGGVCEVYWEQKAPATCGANGSLDLDSNPGCNLDNVNIENVIFSRGGPGKPRSGTYVARVDLFASCMASTPIGWELQVRAGGLSKFYCGQFDPAAQDSGRAGSGITVSTITVP